MNRTLEAFATRTLTRVKEEVASPGKPSRNQKNLGRSHQTTFGLRQLE